jgi:branched-chain amino acid transport system permease protein
MDGIFLLEQLLNGVMHGLMLFLLAAGLTLVFGIMDTLNLAHGSLFMVGGYIAATLYAKSGSFVIAVVGAVVGTTVIALALEAMFVRRLYVRSHLSQVLATLGLIMIMDDAVKYIWGPSPMMAPTPAALAGSVQIIPGLPYPAYRLVILAAGFLAAIGLYLLVNRTRIGMLVRAGASNRLMAELMGVRVGRVFTLVFGLSAALAAVAGALMGPISSVQIGMGEDIMIPALVVIIVGGVGSVRGAFVGALLLGIVDTAGRAFLPALLRTMISPSLAADVGPALASIAIYVLMAVVLVVKPSGLFPARA